MATLDRAEVIALLHRLESETDAEVLEAARALTRKLADAGVEWDELLVSEASDSDEDSYDTPDNDVSLVDGDDAPVTPEQKAEDMALVESLLKHTLSAETREELRAFKGDIEDGEFTAMDRKYCRDLLRRLESRSAR